MIGGGTYLSEIQVKTDRVGEKSPIFDLFSLVAPQRPRFKAFIGQLAKKVQLTLMGSPLRSLQ